MVSIIIMVLLLLYIAMTLCVFNLRNRAGNSVMLLCIINDYVYDFMFMYERSYRDSVSVICERMWLAKRISHTFPLST